MRISARLGYQRTLDVGVNRITVRATPTGASGPRNYRITVTRTEMPSEPRNLSVDFVRLAGETVTARLSWAAPSSTGGMDILSYQARWKQEPDTGQQWLDSDSWAATDGLTTHEVGGLTNGITYIFQVRALNANGAGSPSNTLVDTPAAGLPRPGRPDVEAGSRRVKLSWTAVVDESVSGYQYRLKVGTGSWEGGRNIADRGPGGVRQPTTFPTPLPASEMARPTASRYEQ